MGRLTKRNKDGSVGINEFRYYNYDDFQKMAQKLAHYEDLEEAGRLIELPCAVGDTVWSTRWWDDKELTKKIDGVVWYRRILKHKITKAKFSLYDLDSFGKDVFLTKEEAEKKLQELQNE